LLRWLQGKADRLRSRYTRKYETGGEA